MKIRIITLFIALSILNTGVQATEPNLTLHERLCPDNSLEVIAEREGYGSFTVDIVFTRLDNCSAEPIQSKLVSHDGTILTLRPLDPTQPVHAEYYYDWIQARVDPPADRSFVYRLPCGTAHPVTAVSLSHYEAGILRGNFSDFRTWQLTLEKNDTVFAMRRGEVVRIDGFRESGTSAGTAMYAPDNQIYIQHADGTIAHYSLLRNGSLLVREGDKVGPDTPLAMAGAGAPNEYAVRIAVYYYESVDRKSPRSGSSNFRKVYLDPLFATADRGETRLTDGCEYRPKVTRKLLRAERPRDERRKCCLFGRK